MVQVGVVNSERNTSRRATMGPEGGMVVPSVAAMVGGSNPIVATWHGRALLHVPKTAEKVQSQAKVLLRTMLQDLAGMPMLLEIP